VNHRLFDRIVVVDWSAASTPKRGADSIWIAEVGDVDCTLDNVPTRRQALDVMADASIAGRRTLLAVDFSLGYPAGTAAALGLDGTPWRSMWALLGVEIDDDDRNRNNRFDVAARLNGRFAHSNGTRAGPFWGCPPTRADERLTMTKPARDERWPGEYRTVERRLRALGKRPFSSWQLSGVGAVGSQSLMGIAILAALCERLAGALAVWPFTTGLCVPDPAVPLVVAEVWPSLWPVDIPPGMVKDAAQVESTAARLRRMDESGQLAAAFSPSVPPAVSAAVCHEEGWTLGVR
jgi:precorrin-8X/cobalt-precorrin-8 methylmutase